MTFSTNRSLGFLIASAMILGGMTGSPASAEKMSKERMSNQGAASSKTVEVGGAPMRPTDTIVENASKSQDHTTLVAAVKQAGLISVLSGKGPYTVFAPTNAAFEKLPAGTVDTLMKDENRRELTGVLTYHVVPGNLTAAKLQKRIEKKGGEIKLRTVNGEQLTVKEMDGGLAIEDAKGEVSRITIADVKQSNGVVHVVDTVVLPKG